ncbi:oxygenase MpaB family protein [Qaidamihabitans albus]|uniref:oxygenase MpaB family protein n=1 Tax=Qaidamihabitans albus TaxID=2795733 RepID=UPI0018F213C0|nr:oxygenase MpaB family protein [Qaidamihabitans albus]
MTPPPLGPESLTWRRFGDLRTALLIGWAGTLQAMHPVISTALVQHSDVFGNPVNRLLRSAGPIVEVVYRGRPAGTRVRDLHHGIEGSHADGRRYHALNPEPYFWAHATFLATQYVVAERFGDPLSEAEKERLYQESIRWYAHYGMSTRVAPPDYRAFRAYWERMVSEVLVRSAAIERSPLHRGERTPSPFPWLPAPVWAVLGPVFSGLQMWLARGLLPPAARETLGWDWSAGDERRLRVFAFAVRTVFRLVPAPYRLAPAARRAYREAARREI